MAFVNKQSVTSKETTQYGTALKPGDVAEYVLLPGDPARSDRVAKYLDNAELVMFNREYKTYTGYYKNVRVSVMSTGMGCPSAAMGAEELANIGAKYLIRIGSTAAIKEGIRVGDLIVSTGAMKNEGTSKFFVPDSFPAVPDIMLTVALLEEATAYAKDKDFAIHYGVGSTDDGFYGETPEYIQSRYNDGCINLEMEASGIFTVAMRKGCKAAAIYGVSANLNDGEIYYGEGSKEKDNQKLVEAWEHEIKIVLEAIVKIENNK